MTDEVGVFSFGDFHETGRPRQLVGREDREIHVDSDDDSPLGFGSRDFLKSGDAINVGFVPAHLGESIIACPHLGNEILFLNKETGSTLFRKEFSGYHCYSPFKLRPDGSFWIAGTNEPVFIKWEVATVTPLVRFSGHSETVRCLCQPSDDVIVSCSDDRRICAWNENGLRLSNFGGIEDGDNHTDRVTSVMSLSTNQVVSGSNDRSIRTWDVGTRKCVVRAETSAILDAQLLHLPKVKTIVSGATSLRDSVQLWDASDLTVQRQFSTESEVCQMEILSDFQLLIALYSGQVLLFDIRNVGEEETPEPVARFKFANEIIGGLSRVDDSHFVATARDATASLWKVSKSNPLWKIELDSYATGNAYLGDRGMPDQAPPPEEADQLVTEPCTECVLLRADVADLARTLGELERKRSEMATMNPERSEEEMRLLDEEVQSLERHKTALQQDIKAIEIKIRGLVEEKNQAIIEAEQTDDQVKRMEDAVKKLERELEAFPSAVGDALLITTPVDDIVAKYATPERSTSAKGPLPSSVPDTVATIPDPKSAPREDPDAPSANPKSRPVDSEARDPESGNEGPVPYRLATEKKKPVTQRLRAGVRGCMKRLGLKKRRPSNL